jgi:Ca2+-binding RTX toxin-like protein
VTIGSNLAGDASENINVCSMPCTFVQFTLPSSSTAAGGLASPMDGVIVRWRLKSGSGGAAVNLRVLRPAGDASFTGAGTSATETTDVTTNTWPTRLSIAAGDRVGLNNASEGLFFANTAGAELRFWTPYLADGATAPSSPSPESARELLVNADVEPDQDNDGFGDETQDQCPQSGVTQGPCPTGACQLEQVGTPAGETLTGSPLGDRLLGEGGDDILLGLDGADCLFGGSGRDRLSGGGGGDRLSGGSGRNSLSGGSGNDRISARNRRRDTINCGSGRRDRVTADRRDRVRRCERVRWR